VGVGRAPVLTTSWSGAGRGKGLRQAWSLADVA
jgi:hypothetical protein